MKTLNILFIIMSAIALSATLLLRHEIKKNTRLEFVHSRDILVIDSLTYPKETDELIFAIDPAGVVKHFPVYQNLIKLKQDNTDLRAENGWLWSQVDKESGEPDTLREMSTNDLVFKSELVKGD